MFFIKKIFISYISLLFVLIIFISIFFIPVFSNQSNANNKDNIPIIDFIDNGKFLWPAPGYTKINSYFGKRTAPTSGASSYHKGVDIGAPENSYLVAVCDGEITFVDFLGGGGYTITLSVYDEELGEIKFSYCHCNPQFIVSVGEKVEKGQVIGQVGPKYVYGVPGNKYSDTNGKPTNGATTGPHLHFGMRINNEYVNPLEYL